jgi:hypothetical protein
MKTKLILTTHTKPFEFWTFLPFIPRTGEWLNVKDILLPQEVDNIKQTANQWNGEKGIIQLVEYRHDDNDFFLEIRISCEDA